jgi:hypothetical protein
VTIMIVQSCSAISRKPLAGDYGDDYDYGYDDIILPTAS